MFTVYSKAGCPFCDKFIEVCKLEKLTHVVYELNEHFTKDQFYNEFGDGSTFPQVVLELADNSLKLGGCKESLKYMQEKNLCCQV